MAEMKKKEDIVKNMEYLIKELQKKWEESGEIKHYALVTVANAKEYQQKVQELILGFEELLHSRAEISFKESMELEKENYVMLRFIRKLIVACEEAEKTGKTDLVISMDREEFKFYRSIAVKKSGNRQYLQKTVSIAVEE